MRCLVVRSKSRKYGDLLGETRDGSYYIVLIDGNRDVVRVVKDKVVILKEGENGYVKSR
jgi:hypothetical protein